MAGGYAFCHDGKNGEPIRIEAIVGDQTILVGDPVIFKLRIVNRLKSEVMVSGDSNVKFELLLECREGRANWRSMGDVRAWKHGEGTTYINIDPNGTYALYGFVFAKLDGKGRVFDHAGDYAIRLRMRCILGEFVTEATVIHVVERPMKEMDLLALGNGQAAKRFLAFFHLYNLEAKLPEEFDGLRKGLSAGSLDKSLELESQIANYLELGTINTKTRAFHDAFKELSTGIDEVRRDHIAIVLCHFALKRNKLDDAAAIILEIKDDGLMRGNLLFALNNRLRRGVLPAP